ncbi:hypothetical protein N9682_06120 [Candidatus Pelagibacter sp.]|nr:hypothetical protein [Candidatus Pelagibacter sp.]
MKIFIKVKNRLVRYIKINYFLVREIIIFLIVNIKGSYAAKKLLNDGYFVWNEKISIDLIKELQSSISKQNYVVVKHHPIDLFDMYMANETTIRSLLKEVPELLKVLSEVGCEFKIEDTYINVTKPIGNKAQSSYIFHHDNKFRHYRIIVLLSDANNTSCTHYDSSSNGSIKRFFNNKIKNNTNYSPRNLKLFAWKARSIYIFDTSGWHKAGIPTYNYERPVLNISLKSIFNEVMK